MTDSITDQLEQLEAQIGRDESAIPNLIEGTEKKIVWARNSYQRTEYAIVYIHGFSASRQEIAPVCDQIGQALGANLFYTRLTGHGSDGNALGKVTTSALIQDAVEAISTGNKLGEKVLLIANSTGASLACTVVAEFAQQSVASLVMLSPNFGLKSPMARALHWPGKYLWLRLLQGRQYSFAPQNTAQARFWTTSYPSRALIPMAEIIARARTAPLKRINIPTLMLYCLQDKLLDTTAMLEHFAQIGSSDKKSITYPSVESTQQHVLAGDILSPQTNQQVIGDILGFIETFI